MKLQLRLPECHVITTQIPKNQQILQRTSLSSFKSRSSSPALNVKPPTPLNFELCNLIPKYMHRYRRRKTGGVRTPPASRPRVAELHKAHKIEDYYARSVTPTSLKFAHEASVEMRVYANPIDHKSNLILNVSAMRT